MQAFTSMYIHSLPSIATDNFGYVASQRNYPKIRSRELCRVNPIGNRLHALNGTDPEKGGGGGGGAE